MPLTLLASWDSIERRWKEFAITMLLLETGMLGVFLALDLFLFYIFWEAMLIPMYLIIGIWGGPNRVYAAIKFILYTLTGSLLMLVAILALYFLHGAATGIYTFDLPVLARYVLPAGRVQDLLFMAFALAFAVKVPMWPFHTWLPDAHVEAPTSGSVILAGVLLKMGTYGFLRFCLPLFPQATLAFAPWMFTLAVIGILYGAWVSTVHADIKMLVAILALYFLHGAATGTYTFDLPVLVRYVLPAGRAQDLLFLAFALAFAVKVPMWPFHTWLPDAHVEAPTPGSVILAGVLLKMGTYGFLRFCLPLFPQATLAFAPWMFTLAVIGILYGAWVSTVQVDIKKLVAYSSVSHLGFVVLGLFTLNPQGLVGGIIQMVNHGLSTGALFLIVGMLYERRHTRLIADYGGLWTVVPAMSALFLIVCLSSLGLPGLNGFVGEFLILVGAFQVHRLAAVLATAGIIFAAVYLLWMYQRVVFGPVTREENRRLGDLSAREWVILAPVLALIFWIGVYPVAFTSKTEASVQALITQVQTKAAATTALAPRTP